MRLTGNVLSSTTARIGGAAVSILDGPNGGRATATENDGSYRFDDLMAGNTNVAVTAGGYIEERQSVVVEGITRLDFTLQLDPATTSGTWRGRVRSSACLPDGPFGSFCGTSPELNDSLVLTLTQAGSALTGTINLGGIISNASGSVEGLRLSLAGTGEAQGIRYSFENWNSAVSGSTMLGTFVVRLTRSGVNGSVRYQVMLVDVSRAP
jgi:hypothetical protein